MKNDRIVEKTNSDTYLLDGEIRNGRVLTQMFTHQYKH